MRRAIGHALVAPAGASVDVVGRASSWPGAVTMPGPTPFVETTMSFAVVVPPFRVVEVR